VAHSLGEVVRPGLAESGELSGGNEFDAEQHVALADVQRKETVFHLHTVELGGGGGRGWVPLSKTGGIERK